LAISKWQLAKPTAKSLITEDAENQQLAIGKTNCKGFNHKGHEGNTKEEQKQKYTTEHERGWKPAVSSEPLFVYATADLP
jgi:hypothetical protein